MTHRFVRLLAVLGMAAGLVAIPTAASANSTATRAAGTAGASVQAITPQHKVVFANGTLVHCVVPFLSTGFGPISQCTQVIGNFARPGFYSPITGGFSSDSDFYQLANANFFTGSVCATDGVCGVVGGYGVLATPFGAAIFVQQYVNNIGRWGSWNLHTNTFYPGGGWFVVAP
jgi:hypothetical protein